MTTRRQLLAAVVAAPIAIAAPAHAMASFKCAPAPDASVWAATMARYEALKAEDRQFHDEVYSPAMDPIHELSPPYRFQHVAKNGHVASYYVDVQDIENFDVGLGGLMRSVAAQMEEARAKYAAYSDAKTKVDTAALNERSDAYGSAVFEAERELLNMPAPHLGALAWKVALLKERSVDSVTDPTELEQILCDIRHLAGEAV